jgi:hypothetical protein
MVSHDVIQPADAEAPQADLAAPPTCGISTGAVVGPARYKTTKLGIEVTVSWGSNNTTSCVVRHRLPSDSFSLPDPWKTGVSGNEKLTPPELAIHEFSLHCTSPAGPCNTRVEHKIEP